MWTQRLLTAFVDWELCFTSLPTVFAKSSLKHLSAEQLDTGQRRTANVAESQIWLVCLSVLGKTSLAQRNSINPRYDFICRHPKISKETPCKENALYLFTLFLIFRFEVKSSRPQGSPSRAHCAPAERQCCCSMPAHLPAFQTQEWRLIYFLMPRKELERKEQIGKVKGRRAFVFWPAPCLAHKCMCNFLWKMATDVARY